MTTFDRFRLVRAGILNLYEYGDQVFELAGGRLLLRGHNTSGKTKALELLLPFCLDGDISPRKLDPFAKSSKDMRWNLVGCIDGEQRTGYVWLEFERLSADGTERVAAVIGMKANRNVPGVQRWYAVVRGRRIGDDLALRRGDAPVSKAELAADLGDACPLISTASEYRRVLNEAVFGFPSEDAYQTMLTLMLELRRPHLSKALDPSGVTRLLSAALPEVDHDLIRRLGDGLEQLEDMRRALDRLRRAHRRLERFITDTYSAYARAVLRERADRLRGAETAYENAARIHRETLEATTDAGSEVERIATELANAREASERAEGALTALLQSPEWRSVEAVEQLARRAERQASAAKTAREHADHASAESVIWEAHAARSASDLADAENEATAARERLRTAAGAGGFAGRHAVLDDQLPGADLELWLGLAREQIFAWREVLAEQERLLVEVERTARKLEQAKALEETQELRVRAGRKERADARSVLESEQEALGEAVHRWAAELRELAVPDIDDVVAAAMHAGRPAAPDATEHWREAAQHARGEILRFQADARSRRDATEDRLRTLEDELADLEAQIDPGPNRSHVRPADRDDRAGMPLWRAVDFASGLASSAQAGLEAALEGAGLLDAWVTTDGRLLDPDTLDAVLVAGPPAHGPVLATALLRAPDAPAALGPILDSIAIVDDAPATGTVAIDMHGGFALGPLRGRFGKTQAEHIGASARAAARERRRAALQAEVDQVKSAIDGIEAELNVLTERAERLASEERAFPSADAVAAANRASLIAEQRVDGLGREHAEALEAVQRAGDQLEHARAAGQEHADFAGLPSLLGAAEIRSHVEATRRYEDGLQPVARAVRRVSELEARASEDRQRLQAFAQRAEGLATTADAEAAEARRLTAEHTERESALSAEASQLRERRRSVDADLTTARSQVARLQHADKEAAVTLAKAGERATAAGEHETRARAEREAALSAFVRLERVDVFRLALAEDAPNDHRDAASWTLTRALEVLRAVPPGRLVKEPAEKLAASLTRSCGDLDRDLAQEADMSVFTTVDADGVLAVGVRDGAAERSLPELTASLADEVTERERTLTAEQRRVFGEALLEEISAHLRGRIHEVRTRVDEMNAILRRSATSAGKVVQLGWRPDDDAEVADVIPLISKPSSALGERERDALVAFFRHRIDQAQSAEVATDDGDAGVRTLRDAFDYRRWFVFDLWEGAGTERQRLTAKRHAVGSGGEQAVLVHLPLFAAAASLYDSAKAGPRLIMLDEALSGIDDDTRARVMGALVDLDLDFVMTSHELWGTYHTVPSLAIYQLYREQGLFGVHCERFVWDGSLLREEEQGELFRA
ncbi:MAG TPA: TIGR02680 family protein [Solirubrobacteraceae bacterium]|jgi:uncharacterized protein (TIGR02680 family)|nr:TIGR02680 family protein [Solirubrobacteraceae bacterium]